VGPGEVLAAGLGGKALAAQLAQVVCALADGVVLVPVQSADPGGELGDGEAVRGARASAAARAARLRSLFRSVPPARAAPSREGSGSSSRVVPARKLMPAQSRVVAKRSLRAARWRRARPPGRALTQARGRALMSWHRRSRHHKRSFPGRRRTSFTRLS
jgi:hypothetical protein